MPRRRLMQRFARHQEFADRVMSSHALARRARGMPPLARFLGLAPERDDTPRWATFRPRAARAASPNVFVPPSSDAAAMTSIAAATTLRDPETEYVIGGQGPPTISATPRVEIVPAAPSSPPVGVLPNARTRPDSEERDALRPSSPPFAPPHERMGGRISETPQRPMAQYEASPPAAIAAPILPPVPLIADSRAEGASMPAMSASVPADFSDAAVIDGTLLPWEATRADAERPSGRRPPLPSPDSSPVAKQAPPRPLHTVPSVDTTGTAASATLDEPGTTIDISAQGSETSELPTPTPTSIAGIQEAADRPSHPHQIRAQSAHGKVRPAAIANDDDLIPVEASLPAPQAKPRAIPVEDMFVSSGANRSPTAWVERLNRAAQALPDREGEIVEREDAPVQSTDVTARAAMPDHRVANSSPSVESPAASAGGRVATSARHALERANSLALPMPPMREPSRAADHQAPEIAPTEEAAPAGVPLPSAGEEFARTAPVAAATGAPQDASLLQMSASMGEPKHEITIAQIDAPPVQVTPDAAGGAMASGWPVDRTAIVHPELLFQASGADRSPAAWMERLTRQKPAESPVPAPVAETIPPPLSGADTTEQVTGARAPQPVGVHGRIGPPSAPAPLPEAARRFLRPLVGMDPVAIPVYRDARAALASAAYRADALTDGNVTLLAAGNDVESPLALGLLAHELTHVVRRRDPRFVPPIARAADREGSPFADTASTAGTTMLREDDETVARRVETRVVRAARAFRASPIEVPYPRAQYGNGAADGPGDARDGFAPDPSRFAHQPDGDPWNGLPAPWEPVPDWMDASTPGAVAETNVAGTAMAGLALAPVAPVAQLAGEDRPTEAESATSSPAPRGPNPPVEADLDALARQVYGIVKRRLALERRSAG